MIYDLPTQSLGVSQAPKTQAFEVPEMKDYSGKQMMETGEALQNTGSQILQIQRDVENTLAEAATMQRLNKLDNSIQEIMMNPETGYMAKLSEDAVKATPGTLNSLKDIYETLGSEIKNPLEKALWEKHSRTRIKSTKERIYGHAINQGQVWRAKEAKAGVDNKVTEIIQNMEIGADGRIMGESVSKPATGDFTPQGLKTGALNQDQKAVIAKAMSDKYRMGAMVFAERDPSQKDIYKQEGMPVKGHGNQQAFGPYQFMPFAWGDYCKKAGLPADTPQTPENQDYVAAVNWIQLVDKYGVKNAAIAWNAGEGGLKKYLAGDQSVLERRNNPDNPKSTVANYIKMVEGYKPQQGSRLKSSLSDLYRAAGIDQNSEQAKAFSAEVYSKIYAVKTEEFINNDDPRARKFYNNYKDQITDPGIKARLEQKLDMKDGEHFATNMWRETEKTLPDNQQPDLNTLYTSIESSKLTDQGKKTAYATLNHFVSQRDGAMRRAKENASQGIYKMIRENEPSQLILEAININPAFDQQEKLAMEDAIRKQRGELSPFQKAAAEEKQQRELGYLAKSFKFQEDYLTGDKTYKPEDIAAQSHIFGSQTPELMAFVAKVNKLKEEVKITDEKLKDTIRVLKTSPTGKDLNGLPNLEQPSEEDKAKFVLLQRKVIEYKTAALKQGKPITDEMAILQALRPVVTNPGWFALTTTVTPAYQLNTEWSGEPKTWPKEVQKIWITEDYERRYGVAPTVKEMELELARLKK